MAKIKIYKKRPSVAYASSAIQQNFGEDTENHGLLKWDINTRKHKFIKIPNDVGFYTITIKDNIFPIDLKLAKYPHIKLKLDNTDIIKAQQFLVDLKSNHKVRTVIINNIDSDYMSDSIHRDIMKLGNINEYEFQNKLIKTYIEENNKKVDSKIIKEVFNINKNLNQQLLIKDLINIGEWKLDKLWFSNMFTFGEDNYIDFSNVKGLYGLYAKNKSGKSGVLDVILFLLFDKSSRAYKGIDILNVNETEFYGKICFQFHDLKYYIEKKGVKYQKKNGTYKVRIDIEFWSEDVYGNKISLNGDQRRSTNKNIQEIIGTYENIILTSVSLQNNNAGLIDMHQSDTKIVLSTFMGIDIFEELNSLGRKDHNKIETLIQNYQKKNLSDELFVTKLQYKRNKEEYDTLLEEIKIIEIDKEELNAQILKLTKKIINTSLDLDIEKLKIRETGFINKINIIKTNVLNSKNTLNEIIDKANKVKEFLKIYIKADIDKRLIKLTEVEKNKTQIEKEKSVLRKDIEHQKSKLTNLELVEYDPKCDFCMNNIFVKDAIQTKKSFASSSMSYNNIKQELTKIITQINSIEYVKEDETKYNALIKLKQNLKLEYSKTKSYIETQKSSYELEKSNLKNVKLDIQKFYDNRTILENNLKIQKDIDECQTDYLELSETLKSINERAKKLYTEIEITLEKKKQIDSNIDEMNSLDTTKKAYELYLKATHRNGIPWNLIKKTIPIFEQEINNILFQVVDFKILVHLDEEDKEIIINIVYEDKIWPLKLASGMEKFISSIAIRLSLIKLTNITKPNFLFIDEGMGNLDIDTLNSLPILFDYLQKQFDFVVVISHLTILRDMTEKLMEIDTSKKYSRIYFDN